jgi:hypothetical protein
MLRTLIFALAAIVGALVPAARAQSSRTGEPIPRDVREIYDKGMAYLAKTQTERGDWPGQNQGPGVTGLALMVFLASGDDPNFGLYANNVRRAVRKLISDQNAVTGYLGNTMYHHGFAMLALAEAYGAVDDRHLWPAGQQQPRSIGAALELAVRMAITSQKKNADGGWRYMPESTDADTSVTGAVLMGLLAARNAGIEVPDENIDKAITFYKRRTSQSGQVVYAGLGGFDESLARISIATLVYAVARRKDLPEYKATLGYLKGRLDYFGTSGMGWMDYQRYYQAQAFYQGDVEAWKKWNTLLTRHLKQTQQTDGSISDRLGPEAGTALALLALALNYKFLPIYER